MPHYLKPSKSRTTYNCSVSTLIYSFYGTRNRVDGEQDCVEQMIKGVAVSSGMDSTDVLCSLVH